MKYDTTFRSSHRVLRNFAKFIGKQLCQSLFINKVAGLRPATLLKKKLRHRCFPVNFAKFLGTTFLENTSGRLLLYFLGFADLRLENNFQITNNRSKYNLLDFFMHVIYLNYFRFKNVPLYQLPDRT